MTTCLNMYSSGRRGRSAVERAGPKDSNGDAGGACDPQDIAKLGGLGMFDACPCPQSDRVPLRYEHAQGN